jgi:hypothetical protein
VLFECQLKLISKTFIFFGDALVRRLVIADEPLYFLVADPVLCQD